jgi:hypothetical protein
MGAVSWFSLECLHVLLASAVFFLILSNIRLDLWAQGFPILDLLGN